MRQRLVFEPGQGWQMETMASDGATIQDFVGLTAKGVAMRYSREEIIGSLREAISELETV